MPLVWQTMEHYKRRGRGVILVRSSSRGQGNTEGQGSSRAQSHHNPLHHPSMHSQASRWAFFSLVVFYNLICRVPAAPLWGTTMAASPTANALRPPGNARGLDVWTGRGLAPHDMHGRLQATPRMAGAGPDIQGGSSGESGGGTALPGKPVVFSALILATVSLVFVAKLTCTHTRTLLEELGCESFTVKATTTYGANLAMAATTGDKVPHTGMWPHPLAN